MNIAVLTPLPPVHSGIAHYNSVLLPELAKRHRVTVVVDQKHFVKPAGCEVLRCSDFSPSNFDRVLLHLGNNPHHRFAYEEAKRTPGVIVLHDYVLHHLIVESTLAEGKSEEYVEELRRNHGEAGATLARSRVASMHGELGNFLYPASVDVSQRAQTVIVHNRYAGESLRRHGVTTPITLVGHPFVPSERRIDRNGVRAQLGYDATDVVIGVFGFLTSAKRPEVIFEAFSHAAGRHPRLRLLIVGEPAPNIDLRVLARNLPAHSWKAVGFVPDEDFDAYLGAVDKVVNLRYPSAGETSGALIRVFAAGKPVAVSHYAQFAEYPDSIATKIPFGPEEVESLARFMIQPAKPAPAEQRAWLDANASLDAAVRGYERALAGENDIPEGESFAISTLPVLAELSVEKITATRHGDRCRVKIEVTNAGPTRLNTGVYGAPAYRMIAKVFHDRTEIFDRWLAFSRDLAPGESTAVELEFASPLSGLRLELYHAVEGLPHVEAPPFSSSELMA
jgi:glycosyltransferase involved in cell wall biosynthesis